ncbi:MAG: HNH endonuclease [Cohaesibacter sp.]|jgi:hypothetical protein|nr:HNH endonuclease [Cohaesibacter sp.]
MSKIDAKKIKDLFDYCDGALVWTERPLSDFKNAHGRNLFNSRFLGKEAGWIDHDGYKTICISIRGKEHSIKAHRLVWAWHHGEWPSGILDHIDHNKLNNRIGNLRIVSNLESAKNHPRRKDNTTGVTGVYRIAKRDKWRVLINHDGNLTHVGYYSTLSEAIAARKAAEKVLGFHPNHGRASGGSSNV